MDDGADYRQQQELEEMQQWLLENEGKEVCIALMQETER